MAIQIIDPLETSNKSVSIIDPLEKEEEEKVKPQTQLEKDFPGMSVSEIIDTGGKGYSEEEKLKEIKDPIEDKQKNIFQKALPITSKQMEEVWQGSLGLSDDSKEKLKFIYGDKNTLLGKFNSYLIDTTAAGVDTLLKAGNTIGFAASGLAGDGLNFVYKILDKEPGGAGERLTRDINLALIDVMGRSGTGFTPVAKKTNTIKSIKTGEEITDVVQYANKSPENKIEVKKNIEKIVDDELTQIKKKDEIVGEKLNTTNIVEKNKIINDLTSPEKIETVKTDFNIGDTIIIDNIGTQAKIKNKTAIAGKMVENIDDVQKFVVELPNGKKGSITLTKVKEFNKPKEKIVEDIKTIDTPESLKRDPALPNEVVTKINESVVKFIQEENIKLVPTKEKPLSLQMQEILLSDKYETPYIIRRVAEDNKIPVERLINYIFPSASKSAKELAAYSQSMRYLKTKLDPTGQIFGQSINPITHVIKRLDNLRRGLLVTRIATAVRNYASQSSRITLDSLQSLMDYGLQQIVKPFVKPDQFQKNQVSPLSNLNQLVTNFRQWKPSEFKKVKEQTNKILDQFPSEKNRIFIRYSSDVVTAAAGKGIKPGKVDRILDKAQEGVDFLNFLNKTQEFITRRAVLMSRLDELIKANPKHYNNKNLNQIIRDKEHSLIRASDVAAAVDKALEVTFAKEFNMYKKGTYDAFAARVIGTINSLPFVLTSIVPFPRFLMNSLRFHAEFSPFGFLRFLSSKDRAKIAKGDTSGLSRALMGTGLLFAAMALRKQDYAGEKWYEFKIGDRTIDTRPYNPLAAYLFVADVINRLQDGTLRNIDPKDIITVFAGVRGTTGLYIFDQIVDYITNSNVKAGAAAWTGGLKKFIGETLAGYLTPIQNITDMMAEFYPEMRKSRSTNEEPFVGAFKKKFMDTDLPAYTSATNFVINEKTGKPEAAPIVKESPALGQFTGVRFITEKNEAEKEFDKLQIQSQEIFKSTKIPELDRAYKDILSFKIGYGISEFVKTDYYQKQPFSNKILLIKGALKQVKEETKKELQSNAELAPYLLQYEYNNLSRDERRVINDVIGIDYINDLIDGLKKESKKTINNTRIKDPFEIKDPLEN